MKTPDECRGLQRDEPGKDAPGKQEVQDEPADLPDPAQMVTIRMRCAGVPIGRRRGRWSDRTAGLR